MALRFPDEGEIAALKAMLNHTSAGDVKLHLYHSSITIDEDTEFSDTSAAECDESGYAVSTLAVKLDGFRGCWGCGTSRVCGADIYVFCFCYGLWLLRYEQCRHHLALDRRVPNRTLRFTKPREHCGNAKGHWSITN